MKIFFAVILIISSLNGLSQKDTVQKIPVFIKTGFGKPLGEKITKLIGPEGGNIVSPDTLTELQIPPRALKAVTYISIQPVTNMANAGAGNAYDFEPTGLHFEVPAKLIINYSDSEKKQAISSPQGIIWQDTSGIWYRIKVSVYDSIHKCVTANITHFTNYTRQLNYSIAPEKTELHVNETQTFLFQLGDRLPDKYSDRLDEEEYEYFEVVKRIPRHEITWYVNGVAGGNELFGYIEQDWNNPLLAKYFAPANIPVNDPVRIEARLSGLITIDKDHTIPGVSGYAIVTIYDEYRYTFIGYNNIGGVFHMIDSSSCKIRIEGKNVTMSEIRNYPPWSDWPKKVEECSYTYPNKDSWKGLVEITGMSSGTASSNGSGITGDIYNEQLTNVNITLAPATGNTPAVVEKCTRNEAYIPPNTFPAQPRTIDFSRRQGGINIRYLGLEGVNELSHINKGQGFVIHIVHE